MPRKFYITTAIPYTNAAPHVGHLLEFLQADVLARYHRVQNDEVFFLTGTDEHGIKIAKKAKELGIEPEELARQVSEQFQELLKLYQISNDDFIKTTDQERHWMAVKKIWGQLATQGDLYQAEYEGLYCVGHEAFLKESDLVDGLCPDHKTQPEFLKEKNWFFKLTKYRDAVRDAIASGKLKIVPESRAQEILNLLKDAEDVSFSRPKHAYWGFPVPHDPESIMYVWPDALTNYISAIGYATESEQFKHLWPADVQLIGKDILRFHTILWPAMLLAVGLEVPQAVYVHGFITVEGEKMSKTIGNIINPTELLKKYPVDALRYYLLREIPSNNDGDFSIAKLEARYTGDLANNLGNLVSRVAKLKSRITNHESRIDESVQQKIEETKKKYHEAIKEFKLHEALARLWELYMFANKYINDKKPWATGDASAIASILHLIAASADLLEPFLPDTTQKIREGTPGPLFPKLT